MDVSTTAHKNSEVNLFYQNVRGLKTKLKFWKASLLVTHHDLVAATKTFLDTSVHDAELIAGGWNVVRRERGSRGGGVLLASKPGITMSRLTELETPSGEDLWVTLSKNGRTIYICVVYIKPSASDGDYFDWFAQIESFIGGINGLVYIVGDINLNSASESVRSYYCYFTSFCGLSDYNNVQNAYGSKLDVVLA
jgi:hypothetical protein